MTALRPLAPALALAAALGPLLACAGRPASFPDRESVVASQAEWCAALAKIQHAGASWEHLAACKAAYPTASAAYLRAMTKCFARRTEAAGDEVPDRSQLIIECNDEVAVAISPEDPAADAVVNARCSRMNRCENISVAECKAGFGKLEAAQRTMFTTIYNAMGRFEITDCLESASCADDEEAGRQACYKPVSDGLLWFPN